MYNTRWKILLTVASKGTLNPTSQTVDGLPDAAPGEPKARETTDHGTQSSMFERQSGVDCID